MNEQVKIRDATLQDVLTRLPKVRAALKHLHKVTGKWNVWLINPMEEGRWSGKCWRAYMLLKDFQIALSGSNSEDMLAATARELWKGKADAQVSITTGTWNPFQGMEQVQDRFVSKPKRAKRKGH